MNFSPIWDSIPIISSGLVWLWPVIWHSFALVKYWFAEHQVWWGLSAAFGVISYWYWKDNRE